ncbi:hypothetical protein C2E23DRAFT_805970 [Lenzites betulinus]|nr:hypothetical protein C2E23DRAFT_805970 [Lenzites betulinus]
MQRDAQEAVRLIEEDMRRTQGFVWEVLMGFHALPSVEHLHLHLVSGEFLGEYFKNKKHNNSFHPRMGFFLPLAEVLGWLDADVGPSWFATKAKMESKAYAPILKADMLCPHCDAVYKTMPKLKLHLADVFAEMKKRKIAQRAREKKLADAPKATKDTQLGDKDATSSSQADPTAASQEGDNVEKTLDNVTRPKRKHEELAGEGPEDLKDHDLPEPTPAKRQLLEGEASRPNSS